MCGVGGNGDGRGEVWFQKSGANQKMKASEHSYEQYIAYSEGRRLSIAEPESDEPSRGISGGLATAATDTPKDAFQKSLRQIQLDVDQQRTEPKSFRQPCTRGFLLDDWDSARRESLARVLAAYAYRNESPGYSQGMNFITLVFLASLNGDEEAAFWLLCTLVEDVRDVDFYADGNGSMNGFFADVMVTKHLAKTHLAELSGAMAEYEGDMAMETLIDLLAPKAFISLFCELLPLNSLLMIWDQIFDKSSGQAWPLVGLLALIKASEDEILAAVKSGNMSYQAVIDRTFTLDWPFFSIKLIEMRAKVNLADIKGLRAQFKRDLAEQWTRVEDPSVRKMLMETSGFDMAYLEKVLSCYERARARASDAKFLEAEKEKERCSNAGGGFLGLAIGAGSPALSEEREQVSGLDYEGFLNVLEESGTPMSADEALKVFKVADRDGSGMIDYRELVGVLSILGKGTLTDKLNLVFNAYDETRDGFLDFEQVDSLLNGLKVDPVEKPALMQKLRLLDSSSKNSLSRAEFLEGACTSTELLRVLCPTSLASSSSDADANGMANGAAGEGLTDENHFGSSKLLGSSDMVLGGVPPSPSPLDGERRPSKLPTEMVVSRPPEAHNSSSERF